MITHLTHPRRLRRTTSRPAARSPAGASGGGESFGSGDFFLSGEGRTPRPRHPKKRENPIKQGAGRFSEWGKRPKNFFSIFSVWACKRSGGVVT